MYLTATEVSEKLNISKRFAEILCEQGELEGAICVSGIWLIPDNASIPENTKISELQISFDDITAKSSADYFTVNQVCDILSISQATAKNWIRLKKLIPDTDGIHFSKGYIEKLIKDIKNGDNKSLKSRRNKKSIGGKMLYKDYINCKENIETVKIILSAHDSFTEQEIRIILADFAIKLYKNSGGDIPNTKNWYKHLPAVCKNDVFNALIFELIGNIDLKSIDFSNMKDILECNIRHIHAEDTLGFIYISLKDMGKRKGTGTYFTPAKTVNLVIDNLEKQTDLKEAKFCDPCCGTGNFLLGLLSRGVGIESIFGYDIDPISVTIAKINIFLSDNSVTENSLNTHIVCGDTLATDSQPKFSVILGNPPWGYDFSKQQNEQFIQKYETAKQSGSESFELFIEKGIKMLNAGGHLAYVLPESLLSVSTHLNSRNFIKQNACFEFTAFIGNIFSGVQCPAVILGLKKQAGGSMLGCRVFHTNTEYTIKTERQITDPEFSFFMTDEEYSCFNTIKKVENAIYLKDNSVFALGIVTGNNKLYLSDASADGYEPVFKGTDIFRYGMRQATNYIKYLPEQFQQTAPEKIYRAKEKLIYRFISDSPVFTYDDKQALTLNSCNILIPKISGLNIKYLLAVLNSSVAAFYFGKRYNSVKLLRSHIEQLPIPFITKDEQKEIVVLVDKILSANGDRESIYRDIDKKIMDIYNLTQKNRVIIKNSLTGKKEYI